MTTSHNDLKLKDIDIKLVRSYQQKRIAEGVGPRAVNMEGQLLRSVLKHHEQWKLDGKYEPLPEPASEAGRSLTPEEEVKLIDMAKSRPEWAVEFARVKAAQRPEVRAKLEQEAKAAFTVIPSGNNQPELVQ